MWIHVQQEPHARMFPEALLVIAPNWKPKYPPMVEQINKLWHSHAVEYSTAVRMSGLQFTHNMGDFHKHNIGQKKHNTN